MPRVWEQLKPQDKVAFLSSSYPVKSEDKLGFSNLLSEWDLQLYQPTDPDLACENFSDYFGDQGSPKQRAEAIIDALNNEEVKAIFIRGGSGADEVIEFLKRYDAIPPGIPKRGIPLIGFSDATQLQHYLGLIGASSPVQGPDPGHLISLAASSQPLIQRGTFLIEEAQKSGDPEKIKNANRDQVERLSNFESGKQSAQAVKNFLLNQEEQQVFPLIGVNDAAKTAGVVQGNIVIFNEHSKRADYRALCEREYNPVLLLEGGFGGRKVQEGLETNIRYLQEIGELKNLQAIIISQSDGKCFFDTSLENSDFSAIKPIADALEIPLFFGAPFGHGPIANFSVIPLQTPTSIAVQADGKASCEVASFRTLEDVEIVRNICANRSNPEIERHEIPEKPKKLFQKINLEPIHNAGLASGFHDYIGCAVNFYHRGVDIPALDGVDLAQKNILIDFTTFCSFDVWQNQMPPEKRVMEIYEAEQLKAFKQGAQMSLMELQKTGQLQEVNSVLLLSREQIPEKLKSWLNNFATDHQLNCHLACSYAPDFPEDRLSKVEAVKLRLSTVNQNQLDATLPEHDGR